MAAFSLYTLVDHSGTMKLGVWVSSLRIQVRITYRRCYHLDPLATGAHERIITTVHRTVCAPYPDRISKMSGSL